MTHAFLAAAAAGDDGSAFWGVVVIIGFLYLIYKACSESPPDPPTYDLNGVLKPRK